MTSPLQSRYVGYYERVLTVMEANLPPPASLRIKEIALHGLTSENMYINLAIIIQLGL